MYQNKFTWKELNEYANEYAEKRIAEMSDAYIRRIRILEMMNKNFYDYICELERTDKLRMQDDFDCGEYPGRDKY
jgi:hypothetical protein